MMLFARVGAVLLPRGRRWREVWPWCVGMAAFAAAYAAHVIAVAGRTSSGSGALWMRGGLGHFVATVRFFEGPYGAKPWLLPVLIAAGILGAVIVWRRARRLGGFLIAGDGPPARGLPGGRQRRGARFRRSSWATGESLSCRPPSAWFRSLSAGLSRPAGRPSDAPQPG